MIEKLTRLQYQMTRNGRVDLSFKIDFAISLGLIWPFLRKLGASWIVISGNSRLFVMVLGHFRNFLSKKKSKGRKNSKIP